MRPPVVDVVVFLFSVGIATGRRNAHLCSDAYMSIYQLSHGQYSYGGCVINLPQDMVSLPRLPSTT